MQFLLSFLLFRYAVASQHAGPIVSAVTPLLGAYFVSVWERLVQDIMSAGGLSSSALNGRLWSPGSGHRT